MTRADLTCVTSLSPGLFLLSAWHRRSLGCTLNRSCTRLSYEAKVRSPAQTGQPDMISSHQVRFLILYGSSQDRVGLALKEGHPVQVHGTKAIDKRLGQPCSRLIEASPYHILYHRGTFAASVNSYTSDVYARPSALDVWVETMSSVSAKIHNIMYATIGSHEDPSHYHDVFVPSKDYWMEPK